MCNKHSDDDLEQAFVDGWLNCLSQQDLNLPSDIGIGRGYSQMYVKETNYSKTKRTQDKV